MIHKINKTYDVRVTPNDKHEDGWYDIPDLDRFDAEGKGLVKAFGLFAVCKAIHTLQKAKELPCVFNNFAVFYKGSFETVNLPPIDYLKRILKK